MKVQSKFQMQQFEHRTSNAQHRTSNKDIASAAQALAPRVAPLDHIIETPKVYSHSMFDVGCSMLNVHFNNLVHSSVFNKICCIQICAGSGVLNLL